MLNFKIIRDSPSCFLYDLRIINPISTLSKCLFHSCESSNFAKVCFQLYRGTPGTRISWRRVRCCPRSGTTWSPRGSRGRAAWRRRRWCSSGTGRCPSSPRTIRCSLSKQFKDNYKHFFNTFLFRSGRLELLQMGQRMKNRLSGLFSDASRCKFKNYVNIFLQFLNICVQYRGEVLLQVPGY